MEKTQRKSLVVNIREMRLNIDTGGDASSPSLWSRYSLCTQNGVMARAAFGKE